MKTFFFYFFSTQSVQNLGLAIITMVAGLIVDSGGYLMLEVFFMAWLCGMLLKILNLILLKYIYLKLQYICPLFKFHLWQFSSYGFVIVCKMGY